MAIQKAILLKIHVDSQAALLALLAPTVTSTLEWDTIQVLNDAALTLTRLELVWTKAHIGTKGNERVDALAKEGSLRDSIVDSIRMPLSSLKKSFLHQWQLDWSTSKDAQETKKSVAGPDKRRAKLLLTLPKAKTNLLIRLITNHTSLRSHAHKIYATTSTLCRLCL